MYYVKKNGAKELIFRNLYLKINVKSIQKYAIVYSFLNPFINNNSNVICIVALKQDHYCFVNR